MRYDSSMLLALPDRSSLPDDVEALKDLLIETVQRAQVAALDARSAIERLELQLVALRRTVFGVRSERIAGQADLFEQKVALPLPPENNLTITYERRHRGGGRPALPADLPRVRIEYELSEVERAQFARVPACSRSARRRARPSSSPRHAWSLSNTPG